MYGAALWPLAVARLRLWSALWPPFHQFGSRNRARALRRFCVRCRRCASADANWMDRKRLPRTTCVPNLLIGRIGHEGKSDFQMWSPPALPRRSRQRQVQVLAQRRAYFRPQKPPRAVRWCSRELRVCSRRSISPAPTGAANKGIETDTLQAMVSHNGGGGAWSLARQECAQRRAERQGTRLPCPLNAPARLLRSIWRFETSADEIILASPGPPKPPGGPWSRVTRSEISRRGPARRRRRWRWCRSTTCAVRPVVLRVCGCRRVSHSAGTMATGRRTLLGLILRRREPFFCLLSLHAPLLVPRRVLPRFFPLHFLAFGHFRWPVGFCLDQQCRKWDRMIRVHSVRNEGVALDTDEHATARQRTYL